MEDLLLKEHIVRLRRSDRQSFKVIVEYFHKSIFKFLLFRVNDMAVAEDLLQETFMRLWENRLSIDENLSVKSYLFKTAANLSLNHFRHEKVVYQFREKPDHQQVLTETPYYELEYKELQEAILKTIDEMSDKVRIVFLLCKVDGLSYKEVAEQVGVSVATVESHMVKALRMIREKLDKYK